MVVGVGYRQVNRKKYVHFSDYESAPTGFLEILGLAGVESVLEPIGDGPGAGLVTGIALDELLRPR